MTIPDHLITPLDWSAEALRHAAQWTGQPEGARALVESKSYLAMHEQIERMRAERVRALKVMKIDRLPGHDDDADGLRGVIDAVLEGDRPPVYAELEQTARERDAAQAEAAELRRERADLAAKYDELLVALHGIGRAMGIEEADRSPYSITCGVLAMANRLAEIEQAVPVAWIERITGRLAEPTDEHRTRFPMVYSPLIPRPAPAAAPERATDLNPDSSKAQHISRPACDWPGKCKHQRPALVAAPERAEPADGCGACGDMQKNIQYLEGLRQGWSTHAADLAQRVADLEALVAELRRERDELREQGSFVEQHLGIISGVLGSQEPIEIDDIAARLHLLIVERDQARADLAAKREALRSAECSYSGMSYGDDKVGGPSDYARGWGDCLKAVKAVKAVKE